MNLDSESCVPADAFWRTNREIAELLWRRRDGATISTRVAESISATTKVPIHRAKTRLHGVTALGVGVLVTRATDSLLLGVLAGLGLFEYLERDRC